MKLSDRAREGRELKSRIVWLGVAAAFGFLILAGRLWHLQIRLGESYSAKSEGNFIKELRIPADRGMILDRKGRILVDNRPSYDIYLTPSFCNPCEEVLARITALLPFEDDELARVVANVTKARGLARFKPILVKVDVGRDDLDVIEANRESLPGLDVIAAPHRNYREKTLAAHVLGYLGEVGPEELQRLQDQGKPYRPGDYIGKRGIERRFEEFLKGDDGVERVVSDAKGRKLAHLEEMIPVADRVSPSRPGRNLVLSIDARLQRTAEEALDAGATAGTVVAIDVNTGYLLAVVSKPAFDPNVMTGRITRAQLKALSDDPLEPMIFRATQNHYHPGSLFKVVASLAALEHDFSGSVNCTGGYKLGRRRWRCHKDAGHGLVTAEHAIKVSCDTWFYAAADKIGIDAIADMSRRLGLGRPTGLDLGFEVPGIVPSTEYHDRYTPGGYQRGFALNSVIGQGDSNTTPLQLAVLYAAIANGGVLYRPQVVRRVELPTGERVEEFLPEEKGRLGVPREHLDVVRKGLEMVVNEPGGTAYSKRLKHIRVAGKTGTAQVVRLGGVRLRAHQMDYFERDHAWFAAYAPVEEPQLAVVVLNEHGGHGGAMAAPIAMRVIERYFELLAEDAGPSVRGAPAPAPSPAAPSRDPAPPAGGPALPLPAKREGVTG